MKIAIVVHGRFHGFDLGRALIARGHDVCVFTNYPHWTTRRFGLPDDRVRCFPLHGFLSRLAVKAGVNQEAALHQMFGRWAARAVAEQRWDVIHAFTGVAEELLRDRRRPGELRTIVRGSSHIATQNRLMEEEERRCGSPIARPSSWMMAREQREYQLADQIAVLSTFALESFITEGVSRDKLMLLPLGVDLKQFRPCPDVVAERRRRILAGEPLRVLFVGTASFQKGVLDLASIVRSLHQSGFQFRFVGDIPAESAGLMKELRGQLEMFGRQPQFDLPRWYAWADVFIFPTIQDGYAIVLAQAQASALPIISTTNCSAHDMIRDDESGWIVPIRRPEAFVQRLEWITRNRESVSRMVDHLYQNFAPRDWNDVAADFETGHTCPPVLAPVPEIQRT